VLIRGERRACPLEWLDQFCMRNFTNAAEFDDTLPVSDGKVEASFRLTPQRFSDGLAAWLTQRGKGERPTGWSLKRASNRSPRPADSDIALRGSCPRIPVTHNVLAAVLAH